MVSHLKKILKKLDTFSIPDLNGFASSSGYHKWRIHCLASNRQSLVDNRSFLSKKWFAEIPLSKILKVLEFPSRIRPSTKGWIPHPGCMLDPETDRRFSTPRLWFYGKGFFIWVFFLICMIFALKVVVEADFNKDWW